MKKTCSASGCDRVTLAVGLCSKHYQQMRRNSPVICRTCRRFSSEMSDGRCARCSDGAVRRARKKLVTVKTPASYSYGPRLRCPQCGKRHGRARMIRDDGKLCKSCTGESNRCARCSGEMQQNHLNNRKFCEKCVVKSVETRGRRSFPLEHERWLEKEATWLAANWGHVSMTILSRRLGRSPASIKQKASQMKLPPSPRNEFPTIEALERKLGFCAETIRDAAAKVGAVLYRVPATGPRKNRSMSGSKLVVGPVAEAAITKYLLEGKWDRSTG